MDFFTCLILYPWYGNFLQYVYCFYVYDILIYSLLVAFFYYFSSNMVTHYNNFVTFIEN